MHLEERARKQAAAFREHRNVFIVGVAGVGKSSMSRAAAQQVGMDFVDLEREFLLELMRRSKQKKVYPLAFYDKKYGRAKINTLLFEYIAKKSRSLKQHLISTSTRCMHFPEFWYFLRDFGISFHLHGMPYEVYERRCERNRRYQERFKHPPEKLQAIHKGLYHPVRKIYFTWDLIRKATLATEANYQLRITGNKERDTAALVSKIQAAHGHLLQGGLPPQPIQEHGLGYHPDPRQRKTALDVYNQPLPIGLPVPSQYRVPDLR
jgi:shikimate kinase